MKSISNFLGCSDRRICGRFGHQRILVFLFFKKFQKNTAV
jgi:hypothetical protein